MLFQGSNLITDALLQSIAPCLPNLQHLNLTGCPKVTHNGVWSIISSSVSGLLGLGLEGVSMRFVSCITLHVAESPADLCSGYGHTCKPMFNYGRAVSTPFHHLDCASAIIYEGVD